ncbi:hypothetical protein SCP_0204480 [Sparassis crispa]|uniref:MYND-type domain-containing protein n=1 Tax=Sparassis crispa TaxID=139825 RepID=A0A401GAT1_9APHY|nr:hypothetical protein SCP_0204480 [Sparassis crispa]GBE79251.1 hypothetical protein SCP_0204480 [Sparassis crispa]
MNRRVGAESFLGVGGGTVSKESQKNLEKAEDLCRKRKPEKALPFLLKAMEDGNNLDAAVQMAFLMPNLNVSVKVLEGAEEHGRKHLQRSLGPKCFEDGSDHVGNFWGILETRPYMRVLQALVRLYFENKQFDKSANTIIEMLRLCPGDNMGQREWLPSVLLKVGRAADTLSFVQFWLEDSDDRSSPRGGCEFVAPSRAAMDAARVESLSKWCMGAMAYSGALAAYTLWGDCLLARQYLRIGAKVNPHVLMKILGKVEQPRSLNMDARTFNGPEQAHDYLWLTQDLWMEPCVWAWADGDAEAKACVLRKCSRPDCGRLEERVAEFKRCGGCKEAVYCGPECQKEDWKVHKAKCQEAKRIKELVRAMGQGKKPPGTPSEGYPLAAAADFTASGISTRFYN